MKKHLVLLGEFDDGVTSVALDKAQSYRVGRAAESDIVIGHLSVSRQHAELRLAPPGLAIQDVGSRNGTYVDDKRLDAGTARPGQRIRFGDASFLLTVVGDQGDDLEGTVDDSDALPEAVTPHFLQLAPRVNKSRI